MLSKRPLRRATRAGLTDRSNLSLQGAARSPLRARQCSPSMSAFEQPVRRPHIGECRRPLRRARSIRQGQSWRWSFPLARLPKARRWRSERSLRNWPGPDHPASEGCRRRNSFIPRADVPLGAILVGLELSCDDDVNDEEYCAKRCDSDFDRHIVPFACDSTAPKSCPSPRRASLDNRACSEALGSRACSRRFG